MERRTESRKIAYRIFILAGLTAVLVLLLVYADELKYMGMVQGREKQIFTVDKGSGFYAEDISVSVLAPGKAEVWYTMDCSEPSRGGEGSFLYEEPILLEALPDETVYTLKIKAWYENEEGVTEETETCTYSYILGSGVESRYDTMVVCITGEPEGLFGYEDGIFAEGRRKDEFLAENPGFEGEVPLANHNYGVKGKEGEREVNIHIFSPQGEVLLEQNCGLRIAGHATRQYPQKSMQLFARKEYDEQGNFHVELFPNMLKETDGTILDRENRIKLRNSGNDFNYGFIRDHLVQNLACQWGYELTYQDVPVAVYLNNEYYGTMWVRESFSTGALENRYGDFNGEFVKMEINEYLCYVKEEEMTQEERENLAPYIEEFNGIYQQFSGADMGEDEIYRAFSEKVDVDNLLRYYAIELYIGSFDWPFNNAKVYRYVSDNGEYAEEGLFDGRYRYLLFDTDYALLYSYSADRVSSYAADADTVELLIRTGHAPVFNALMTREECRHMLVNDFCDLMNDAFSYENARRTLEEMDGARRKELAYFLSESDMPDENVTMELVDGEVEKIRGYFEDRPKYMYDILEADFPICRRYELQITGNESAQISVNSIQDKEGDFKGIYYAECGLTLKAKVREGRKFEGWMINGKLYAEEELVLDREDLWELLQIPEDAVNGEPADYIQELQVEVLTSEDEEAGLCIAALHEKGSEDLVCLYNPTDHSLSTEGLYLSDDEENPGKYSVPEKELGAGECLVLYGEKHENILRGYRLSFNIRNDEHLIFSDKEGRILEDILIPGLTEENTFYVKNLYTGKYEETRPEKLPYYLQILTEE